MPNPAATAIAACSKLGRHFPQAVKPNFLDRGCSSQSTPNTRLTGLTGWAPACGTPYRDANVKAKRESATVVASTPEVSAAVKTMQSRILIADDQPDVLRALRLLLKGHGYTTETAASPSDLLEALTRGEFDLLLMDLNYARDTTSGREGLDLLTQLRTIEGVPPIVVMTGWATVGIAVEAMQRGVADFVEKPWTNTQLLEVLSKQISLGRERRESARLAVQATQAQNVLASQFHLQESEIAEARAIQEGFLPKEIPQMEGYEIASAWQSARMVGGDYFDVLPFESDTFGLCIADVAGKGLPAALLMSNLQAAVRGLASSTLSPDDLCARLNALLCRNMASDRFVTLFYAQLEGASRRLRYTSAGHNPPFVLHQDGSHERLREGGGVLGVFANQTFHVGLAQLRPGDRVVLFTDGVTEACNAAEEEFGEDRLLQVLQENRRSRAQELQKQILRAASDFSGGLWQDDATLLVVTVL
jgi:sigma-B regulation protein RsbU (phosphoserine phosphatase)